MTCLYRVWSLFFITLAKPNISTLLMLQQLLQLTNLVVARCATGHRCRARLQAHRVGWVLGSPGWSPGAPGIEIEASCRRASGTQTARWWPTRGRRASRLDRWTTRPALSGAPAASCSCYTPRSPSSGKRQHTPRLEIQRTGWSEMRNATDPGILVIFLTQRNGFFDAAPHVDRC